MTNNERMAQMLRAAALDIAENAEELVDKKEAEPSAAGDRL